MTLLPAIAERRSPRAYDSTHEVNAEQMKTVLEAARWAPSAMNRQPWAFLVGHRGDEVFKGIYEALNEGNQIWADSASVLLVTFVEHETPRSETDAGRAYELGLAVGQLSIQAQSMGLITHQMGGFSKDQIRSEFRVPHHLHPMTVIAIGAEGEVADLPEHLAVREVAPRVRRDHEDFIHVSGWQSRER